MKRICTKCNRSEPDVLFGTYRNGNALRTRSICRQCFTSYTEDSKRRTGALRRKRQRYNEKIKVQRKQNRSIDRWIVIDSKGYDRKHEFENDLDREFVRRLITNPCCYCGEDSIRMTLDRIDNSKGHTKRNVRACCIRCNYIRKNMPYTAWLVVAVGVRMARRLGLFGAWIGSCHK